MVDLTAIAQHRRALLGEASAAAFDDSIELARERARKVRAERLRIELQNAQREGMVVEVRAVENAAYAAVGTMRSALSQASGDLAEEIARRFEAEASLIRPHIRRFERLTLDAFVKGLSTI